MSQPQTVAEYRLDRFVRSDQKFRLFPFADCEAFVGRDDTGGRYEGDTVYPDLSDCADQYDWSRLEEWCEYAESSDCETIGIF